MTGSVTRELVLIDLSSIAYPIWHTSQAEPDPNATSIQTVARVRSITAGKPHVAVCCDSGRSFRADIAASYKANRPEQDGTLKHQITLACEQLAADGFPVWAVKGFEADDLIASAVARALATQDCAVIIVTADKDLLQLVGPLVKAMSVRDGSVLDAEGVGVKLGVRPDQIRDYLTLVGDTADNIAGARGIGPKKAADLLAKFDSLDKVYERLEATGGAAMGLQPAVSAALHEFKNGGGFNVARQLVALRADVDIPFEQVFADRVSKGDDMVMDFDAEDIDGEDEPIHQPAAEPTGSALAVREPASESVLIEAQTEWERGLDPRSMGQARTLAKDMFQSRMFSAYGNPQGVLSTIMVGRELGIPAMASLRAIHIIEGRHSLSAQLMVALVLKSGFAEYFDPEEFDEKHAVFVTKRRGGRKEIRLVHTIEMAMTAGLVKPNSNWIKVPTDMLVSRAQSRLCRLVYPDIIINLYTPDELAELRMAA